MSPLLELALNLPRRGSRRRLRALYEQLRAAILDGRLHPGLRLPSTRGLAALLGVSRATIVATYDRLLGEGYVQARRGAGTFVVEGLPARRSARPRPRRADSRLALRWRDAGAREAPSEPPLRCDFRIGVPDPAAFPVDLWRRLIGRASRALGATAMEDIAAEGRRALRAAIAAHVSATRAVACAADDVVVTSGAQQAFDLLARILVTPARTVVAIEDPGYPRLREAFRAADARLAPVPVDAHGLIVGRVPAAARVICVTPSHQFPVGAAMSLERRAELLALAAARGAVIIEDDYDSEFRFAGRPLDALQTLDRADSVVYVGTFSKTLSPALRTGFIVAPPWAHDAIVAAKRMSDGGNPLPVQDALALMIGEGHLARHVRRMRRLYEGRRALLLEGLRRIPWLEPAGSVAGLHVTAWLPRGTDAARLLARARAAGVGVRSLGAFHTGAVRRDGLIFGYGATTEAHIAAGIARLNALG